MPSISKGYLEDEALRSNEHEIGLAVLAAGDSGGHLAGALAAMDCDSGGTIALSVRLLVHRQYWSQTKFVSSLKEKYAGYFTFDFTFAYASSWITNWTSMSLCAQLED